MCVVILFSVVYGGIGVEIGSNTENRSPERANSVQSLSEPALSHLSQRALIQIVLKLKAQQDKMGDLYYNICNLRELVRDMSALDDTEKTAQLMES